MPSVKTTTGVSIDLGSHIPYDILPESRKDTLMYNDAVGNTHVITRTNHPELLTLQSYRSSSQNPDQEHNFLLDRASESVRRAVLNRPGTIRSTPLSGGLNGGYSPGYSSRRPVSNQPYADQLQVMQYCQGNEALAGAVSRFVSWARRDHDTRSVAGLMQDANTIEDYLGDPNHADDAALLLGLQHSPGSAGSGAR